MEGKKHVTFGGRLVIVGFGSVGQGTLPLLLRHIDMPLERIRIVTGDERGRAEAEHLGVNFEVHPLTRENYRALLEPLIGPGDFLLNLSVDVSSVALIELCYEKGAMYLDTCIEPWLGGYTDQSVSPSHRSNYGLREAVQGLRSKYSDAGPTVLPTHGANPGLISHWVKQALINIARDIKGEVETPRSREAWAQLAMSVGMKVVHCAERDTQRANPGKRRFEFVNTWSVDGFIGEGSQPCELGWGSHEKHFPPDGKNHEFGCKAAIYLTRPGASVRVRSWTPMEGQFHGFLITHGEAISISDYFTVRENGQVAFRPTCHYAYHPCDDTVLSVHELAGKGWIGQQQRRVLMDEIYDGIDELGALLMGHERGAYWYGSQISVHEARTLAPYNNATSIQVAAGVMGGVVWAMENPRAGVIDPDDVDFERVLEIAKPYLGKVVGVYSDWTPLSGRNHPFPEDVDASDPWQFKNFRVV
ncbi:MAG TPA: saccharopine dehydrogenase C-terminal domain-containing protein [Burkholderiales bacterium]|nr:saccharopine dehydrogenase C-terminal domain-containing protein [Burkholderiales bacterium]